MASLKLAPARVAPLIVFVAAVSLGRAQNSSPGASASNSNSTDGQCPVNIPGFEHHGNCNLLCSQASWIDVLTFYFGNYVAHAATIISSPGQSTAAALYNIVMALLFPGTGVSRGMMTIFSLAKFAGTDLGVAARAGALCAVVKTPEKREESSAATVDGDGGGQHPLSEKERRRDGKGAWAADTSENDATDGDQERLKEQEKGRLLGLYDATQDPEQAVVPQSRTRPTLPSLIPRAEPMKILAVKIQGYCRLPQGYDLVVVPENATFEEDGDDSYPSGPLPRRALWARITSPFRPDDSQSVSLSGSWNFIKIVISVWQLLYAITTLYQARGDQLQRYGYAAFGLTVAPYAWMSLVNLVGNLVCPQYDTMYLVESAALDELRDAIDAAGSEAQKRFGVRGTVGRLTRASDEELRRWHEVTPAWDHLKVIGGVHDSRGSRRKIMLVTACSLVASIVPLAIVGSISSFSAGQSAKYQRVWTMMWLVCGIFVGAGFASPVWSLAADKRIDNADNSNLRLLLFLAANVVAAVYWCPPAVGGYVVVGQMIKEFGSCFTIG